MNKRIKKYIVLLLTIVICFSGMAVTAFAAPASDTDPDSTHVVEHETDSGVAQITLSFDLDGGSGLHNSKVNKGTMIYELKTPVRDGYKFAGWVVDGEKVSSSYQMDTDTFLTATWVKEEAVSSKAESETEPESSAEESSEIAAAVTSEVSSAASESSSAVAEQTAAGTRFSTIFYIGILLVVLGISGLVLLIVRQIHNKDDKGGKGGPKSSGGYRNDGFTDISSYSDGRKNYKRITPSEEEYRQPVRVAAQPAYAAGSGNFDWEKFFNEKNS
jgi:uncharacterized membrane protein